MECQHILLIGADNIGLSVERNGWIKQDRGPSLSNEEMKI
jgi:hypothetical protein